MMIHGLRPSLSASKVQLLELTKPEGALKAVELARSVSDRDRTKPLPGGGFMLNGSNGERRVTEASFRMDCGSTSDALNNEFRLSWSAGFMTRRSTTSVRQLMALAVDVWEPDFGWISDRIYDHETPEGHMYYRNLRAPELGWMVYLRDRMLSKAEVPSAHQVLPIGTGTLIIASSRPIERRHPENAAHLERIRQEARIEPAYELDTWPKRRKRHGNR